MLAVELSSFQLHWSPELNPLAATVLNVSADHLDWHGGLAEYAAAKGCVCAPSQPAVVDADDEACVRAAGSRRALRGRVHRQ